MQIKGSLLKIQNTKIFATFYINAYHFEINLFNYLPKTTLITKKY